MTKCSSTNMRQTRLGCRMTMVQSYIIHLMPLQRMLIHRQWFRRKNMQRLAKTRTLAHSISSESVERTNVFLPNLIRTWNQQFNQVRVGQQYILPPAYNVMGGFLQHWLRNQRPLSRERWPHPQQVMTETVERSFWKILLSRVVSSLCRNQMSDGQTFVWDGSELWNWQFVT